VHDDFLLYDGDCPVCNAYIGVARLREIYPGLRILNARAEPSLVEDMRQRGFEINEGMILSLDRTIYFGAQATRMIAAFGQSSPSIWRRTALGLVGAASWARRLYPWLNGGRRLLLRLLGRPLIG
jgi:predicted DCC family thiol-disulfide oxidoreductase YuxK